MRFLADKIDLVKWTLVCILITKFSVEKNEIYANSHIYSQKNYNAPGDL